jgi:hypothetical protein
VAAAEIRSNAEKFERVWRTQLPYVPATLYLFLGPRPEPGFSLERLFPPME